MKTNQSVLYVKSSGPVQVCVGSRAEAETTPQPRCFQIIRFRYHGRPRVIRNHLTEAEAQAHCSREDTHKKGVWFDGFDYMPGCRPTE